MRHQFRALCWAVFLVWWCGVGCDDGSAAGADTGAIGGDGATDGGARDDSGVGLDGGGRDARPADDAEVLRDAQADLDGSPDAEGADLGADQGTDLGTDLGADQGVAEEVPVATPAGAPVTATIGAEGGSIQAADGARTYTLEVPAGALASDTEITLTPATLTGLAEVVEGYTAGVILEPSGLRFAMPATLVIEGAEPGELSIGMVFDDEGHLDWQHPAGPDERLTLQIAHFSGAALADIAPGAWGEILEATGELPVFTFEIIADVSLRDVPERFLCVAVTTGAGRPLPQVPVTFEIEGVLLGRLTDEDLRTQASGNACVRWIGLGAPPPEGEAVVISATPFKNALFQRTVFSRFRWGGDVPDVQLVGLDREQLLPAGGTGELCAVVSFPDISPPLGRYPVRFRSSNGALVAFDYQGLTDDTGRFCETWSVPERLELEDDLVFVDLTAEVPLGIDRVGVAQIPVAVESARLSAQIEPGTANSVLAGSASVPVCVIVMRGAQPARDLSVDFTLEGEGLLSLASAITDARGRACVGYTPPVAVPDGRVIIGAAVLDGGSSANAVHVMAVEAAQGARTYTGTWSATSSQTQIGSDGLINDSSTRSSEFQASFRLRREADGTWSGEMLVGGGAEMRGEACYVAETTVLTGFSQIVAAPHEGTERLGMVMDGTFTPATRDTCELRPPEPSTTLIFALLQPDGRYFHLNEGSGSEDQISPDDGSFLGNSAYAFREQVEVRPVD